jgi:APA family basic amino acid/polyamine antiporter
MNVRELEKLAEKKVFLREATGLVREIGFLQHVLINGNALPLMSVAITPWYIWVAIPGGDPIIATLLAFLFSAFGTCICYAMTAATFPRSASPYVTQTRVLHPAIGWPSDVLMWVGQISFIGLLASMILFWAVAPGLYAMGISSGNQLFINAAWALIDPIWTMVFGTLIIVLLAIVVIPGTRALLRFNMVVQVLMFVGVIAMIAILATSTPERFAALTPKYLNQDYNTILSTARESYPSMMVPISFGAYALLASIGLSAGAVNSYWNAWAAGEVKRGGAVRMQVLSMVIPCAIATVISVVTFALAYNVAGREFLVALTQLMTYNAAFFKAPFFTALAGVTFIPMMLADNMYIQLLLLICFSAAALAYIPFFMLLGTRGMFAWAFDRLLPAKFAEINDRWHSPVFATLFILAFGWACLLIFTYYAAYTLFFFAATWDIGLISITILCVAAMLLPMRKRLWDLSPAKKYMVGSVPAIVIVGIIGTFYNAVSVWIYSTAPAMGFGLASLELVMAVAIAPFILYWIIRAIRRRQGIDLDFIFREIPPE